MTNVLLYGSKGGVGTTTTALALARLHPGSTLVQVSDVADAAMLAPGELSFSIVSTTDLEEAHQAALDAPGDVVLDLGTRWRLVESVIEGGFPWRRVLVCSNDYCALRLAVAAPRPDAVACVFDAERVLHRSDVENVLHGLPLAIVMRDRAVERLMDAGRIGGKLPDTWRRHVAQLDALLDVETCDECSLLIRWDDERSNWLHVHDGSICCLQRGGGGGHAGRAAATS